MPDASDERGAYVVLYALLMVVLIGVGAFVVDISMMRESRATNRSAADAAVVAAASRLNQLDPNASLPRVACETAWDYLMASISGLESGKASCSSFPETAIGPPACTVATTPIMATATPGGGEWTVRITWPVPDSSPLLSNPDVYGSQPTQAPNVPFDGTGVDACSRMAVEVTQANSILLGAAMGFGGTVDTRAASVARSTVVGETSEVIAALNILEQTRCAALRTEGQGKIEVVGVDDKAGVIAVESDGRGSCTGAETHTIQTSPTGNDYIRADGPDGQGTGIIQTYALNPPDVGNPGTAFTLRSPPDITPTPSRLEARYGAKPVLDIFNCTSGACSDGGGPWANELVSRLGAGTPQPYTGSETFPTTAFKTLPGPDVPTFTCSIGTGSTVVVPAGNWFVDCPSDTPSQNGLSISGTLVFQGGTIVTRGKVEVGSNSGCLAINVPGSDCPTANIAADPDTTDPAPTADAILFVRSGRVYKVSQAQLYMPQTFVYLQNGVYDLGGGTGNLLWTTPLATDCASAADENQCRARRFNRMVLWSESNQLHSLGGQTTFSLRGVLFTPSADTEYTGQGVQKVADAQFWTSRLSVKGQGALQMRSDPDASVSRPFLGVSLIR